jgi:hypothetical protein
MRTSESKIMNDQNPAISRLRERTAYLRDLQLRIKDVELQLNALRAEARSIAERELVEMMNEAGTDQIGLPPSGNLPGMEAELRPYYSANIAAGWDEERREKAFDALASAGASDLIKTRITLDFPRDSRAAVIETAAWLKKHAKGASFTIKDSVHSSTLTAWVRECFEKGHTNMLPDLEVIGASTGWNVILKDRKE